MSEPHVPTAVRRLGPRDSLAELTALLHRAYAPLGAAGLNFTAVDQDEATTARRCARGDTFVAERDGRLVGTITLAPLGPSSGYGDLAPAGAASLEQFAVEPGLQGSGIGRALARAAEARAAELRVPAIVGDTSERAPHLVALYERAGFRVVGRVQWPGKIYRSVVLRKDLA